VYASRSARKRPAAVTWLAAGAFSLAAANLSTVVVSLARWPIIASLEGSRPAWVPVMFGGGWGLAWLAVGWGLWRLKPWARPGALILFLAYELAAIGQQFFLSLEAHTRARLPFASGVAILLSGLVAFSLARPRVREAFLREPLYDPQAD